MTEHEINQIRKKFIWVSTLTLFAVMLLMGGAIYIFSTTTIRNEAYQIMHTIAENDGELPEITAVNEALEVSADGQTEKSDEYAAVSSTESAAAYASGSSEAAHSGHSASDGGHSAGQHNASDSSVSENVEWSLEGIFGIGNVFGDTPDYIYTTRYFAVLFDADQSVEEVKTSHIAHISEEQAEEYGRIALTRFFNFGSFGRYYYYTGERENGGTIVIYLDRTAQITLVNRVLFAALSILALGTLLSFFFMRFFSKDIVKNKVKNVERQKQFITNASHELKTPLAVIRANTEMTEMLDGETEWTQSTLRQVDRMNGLIANLVQIARAQENSKGKFESIDIVPIISETADSFAPIATNDGKTLTKELPESLVLKTDDSKIRQLVSLLVDNAVKYCDDAGEIKVSLNKAGRAVVLAVSNDYADGANTDYTRFFERFYRQDEAHTISSDTDQNSGGKSGYGIGLSIADSVVESLGGTIGVSWKDGRISFECKFKS